VKNKTMGLAAVLAAASFQIACGGAPAAGDTGGVGEVPAEPAGAPGTTPGTGTSAPAKAADFRAAAKGGPASAPDPGPQGLGGATSWAHSYGSAGTDAATAILTDASGNAYITGYFSKSIDVGCGALVGTGNYDLFVAKLDGQGACVWSARAGGTDTTYGTALAIDAEGGLYVAGAFRGDAQLGDTVLTSTAWTDGLIARFTPNGGLDWAKRVGGLADDLVRAIVVRGNELVIAGGYFGQGNFGGADVVSVGDEDAFVAGYDAKTGAYAWHKSFGGPSGDTIASMTVDAYGHLVVGGHFEDHLQLDAMAVDSAGWRDAFFAVLGANGAAVHASRFGGPGDDTIEAVAVDKQGDLVVTGTFQNAMDLGGLVAVGSGSGFVAKFDGDRHAVWSKTISASSNAGGHALAVDADRNVFVAGSLDGSETNGLGATLGNMVPGSNNAFVARYTADGSFAWSRLMSSGSNVVGSSLAVAAKDVLVVGAFDASLVQPASLSSAGETDAVVVSMAR
jgi:hypothetical protein